MVYDTATWWRLAAHAKTIAFDMRDPVAQQAMQEIAARYELLALRCDSPVRDRLAAMVKPE